ncbi:TetR/AcrR family transcriptional regulator [Aquimarina algicola]|uniref:TetR/AcrR family transcriptional regulator n=1 Tax=Aquimarina algicola TaxID=2589995 RepID=A0A504JDN9_9FLAO|nr:TetR/AcrR family transcriptional regulator [Aquimarina algicola]TPN86752.1 TetR/AcrR family transcriptional regulator [Aquimarina algicola]
MKAKMQWIEEGYKMFSHRGPEGIKIEKLAREVGINKSSFYHHFADVEIFTEHLLEHHLGHIIQLAEKEKQATNLDELIEIFIQHKTDLLFNRYLRVHRNNPRFLKYLITTNEIAGNAILNIWAQILELEENSYLARLVLKLSVENFFLQITDKTINQKWLKDYFNQLKTMVREFKKNNHK